MARLPEKVAVAVVEFLSGALVENPYRLGKELGLEYWGTYSARRGDYRVLYEIDEERRRVLVITVEHRSDVYRRRGS